MRPPRDTPRPAHPHDGADERPDPLRYAAVEGTPAPVGDRSAGRGALDPVTLPEPPLDAVRQHRLPEAPEPGEVTAHGPRLAR
ncbi:MAG: hypothetical protein IPN01_29490 [Deltaproteobacteria bacterium]|nr:hypothetical protein [Deltaproteobacteria bacterium]